MFWTIFFEASAVIGLILAVSWVIHARFIRHQADDEGS